MFLSKIFILFSAHVKKKFFSKKLTDINVISMYGPHFMSNRPIVGIDSFQFVQNFIKGLFHYETKIYQKKN